MDVASSYNLSRFLAANYAAVKSQHPGEGRRKWRLRVARQFFALSEQEKLLYMQAPPMPEDEVEEAPYTTDDDPLDSVSTDAPGLGLLVRTDFTDEPAWQAFLTRLKDAESEFSAEPDTPMDEDEEGESDEEDEEGEGDNEQNNNEAAQSSSSANPAPIFHIIDPPPSSSDREHLAGITNLAALRLLNDVDVRRIPGPPRGVPSIKPPNRLVDYHSWQEVYTGKIVWVYDAKSNNDQSVRLVSQKSSDSVYGSATADSWRARVSHICELQVNLASGAMSIDFGGMDRWDWQERARNMTEAEEI